MLPLRYGKGWRDEYWRGKEIAALMRLLAVDLLPKKPSLPVQRPTSAGRGPWLKVWSQTQEMEEVHFLSSADRTQGSVGPSVRS